eukprot:156133-Pelagomonas_calceolata.AAC.3
MSGNGCGIRKTPQSIQVKQKQGMEAAATASAVPGGCWRASHVPFSLLCSALFSLRGISWALLESQITGQAFRILTCIQACAHALTMRKRSFPASDRGWLGRNDYYLLSCWDNWHKMTCMRMDYHDEAVGRRWPLLALMIRQQLPECNATAAWGHNIVSKHTARHESIAQLKRGLCHRLWLPCRAFR